MPALKVLDLFAGIGGLSVGFRDAGFEVSGVDIEHWTCNIFQLNCIGEAIIMNLSEEMIIRDVPVVIGGPPCRPWSSVNLTRRLKLHPDRQLVGRFFKHIQEIQPEIFLMENVIPIKTDSIYKWWLQRIRRNAYDIDSQVIRYSDFGAPVSRHRLFTVGVRNSHTGAKDFFARLEAWKRPPASVREAIYWLRNIPRGEYPEHIWPEFRTISRYTEYYRTGKYGWFQLDYELPSPSFGNIMKTYILHPEAGNDGIPLRVVSVREALCIMGFDRDFLFPDRMPFAMKYQMIADSVSPVFSRICAKVIREMLEGVGKKDDNWKA